jgi:hypothetical protein
MGHDVELVNVAICANEVDVLAVVGVDVAVEGTVGTWSDAVAGEMDEVVIDPMAVGGDEEFVDVVVGADEVDVLAAVVVGVAIKGRIGSGQDAFGKLGEIVVDPMSARAMYSSRTWPSVPMKLMCWPPSGPG